MTRKTIFLYINTANNLETRVKIEGDGIEDEMVKRGKTPQAQEVLRCVEKILKKHTLRPGDVNKVRFYPGPGSFTGLRVGAAIANTWEWILGNQKQMDPVYE